MPRLTVTKIYRAETQTDMPLPLADARLSAGFPSPAENYFEETLDLNKFLIKHPAATFFVKVEGDSMIDAGIFPGDLLIVDRAVEPYPDAIVVAVLDGEFTVKRIRKKDGRLFLMPENRDYAPIEINEETAFLVWGVATYTIHPLSK
ncbi:MAG TPA: translesion error-prone DNA polymerase V autoproteolytic subunit [bacterium]|nr:translesion error-prone DNA polymerase V autoproteolytic subunit [bacterium]